MLLFAVSTLGEYRHFCLKHKIMLSDTEKLNLPQTYRKINNKKSLLRKLKITKCAKWSENIFSMSALCCGGH